MRKHALSPAQRAVTRSLVGKTIARVELQPFDACNGGGTATDPVVTFTDGTALRFLVQETEETGDYGVQLAFPAKPYNRSER
jgi:hypothetical protein